MKKTRLLFFFLLCLIASSIFICAYADSLSADEINRLEAAKLEETTVSGKRTNEIPEIEAAPFKLPASLTIIEDEAFEGIAIVKIELPETVVSIGDRAFANISTLRSIQVPVATKSIASTAFIGSNHVTIAAVPNSYARKFAKSQGLPFSPIATFCATMSGVATVSFTSTSYEAIAEDSVETQSVERQWHKLEEIKVVGTLDVIYNSINSRGPPMA